MDSIKTGKFISECRKQKGMTQKELADILNISNRTVSKWENGDGYPDVTIMPQLSQVLGISVDELLAGETVKADENKQEQILFEAVVPQENKYYDKLFSLAFSLKIPMWCRIVCAICMFAGAVIMRYSETVGNGISVVFFILAIIYVLSFFTPKLETLSHMNRQRTLFGKKPEFETVRVTDDKISLSTGMQESVLALSDITGFYDKDNLYILRFREKVFLYITKDSFTVGDSESFASFIRGKMTYIRESKSKRIIMSVLTIFLIAMVCTSFFVTIITNANNYTYEEYVQMSNDELLQLDDKELCDAISCKVSEKRSTVGHTLNEYEKVYSYVDDFYYHYAEYGFCEYLYSFHYDDDFEELYNAFDAIGLNEISLQINEFVEKNNINPNDFNSKNDYEELYSKYPFAQFDKEMSQQTDLIERKLAEYIRHNLKAFD